MKDVPLGPAPALPAPLSLPELDAIRSQEGQESVYRALRSLEEQQNAVIGYLRNTSGRGALRQSAGPFLAGARATACSVTLYWQTRGDGFAPQFYQVWRADAGTVGVPTSPTFDDALRTARIPAELNTPFITQSRYIWADNDFLNAEVLAGTLRAYWITAIDVDGNESLPVAIAPIAPGICGGGGGVSNEILIIADTSTADQEVTLPDPTSLPDNTVINVKNWASGGYELHIAPGVGGTIDGVSDGIRTKTPNQGYRLRYGPSADEGSASGLGLHRDDLRRGFGWHLDWRAARGHAGHRRVFGCDTQLDREPGPGAELRSAHRRRAAPGRSRSSRRGIRRRGSVRLGGGGGGTGHGGDSAYNQGGGFGGGGGARKIVRSATTTPSQTRLPYGIHQGGAGGAQIDIPPAAVGSRVNPGEDGGPAWLG